MHHSKVNLTRAGSHPAPMAAGGKKRLVMLAALAAAALFFGSRPAHAQASKLAEGPPPPSAVPAPPKPVWDPLGAAKSIEIGKFYMNKGKYGAALSRFRQAARLQPGLAEPFLLIGQVYEKQNYPQKAIAAYREYLKLYPTSPDRKKMLHRIAKLKHLKRKEARDDSY